jgi:transposase
MKVKVHIILDKENYGLGIERLFNSKGREFLSKVPLTEPRKTLLNEHMNLLGFYEDLVERENAWVTKAARNCPEAKLLMTIPGVGELSALVLLAELGDVTRFKSSAAVANFVGLVPSVHSSADKYRYGRLTKQGSAHLRWILVQAAWQSIRSSFELRCHFNSVMQRGGKKAAIVSVARKILQIAYRVLRDKKPYQSERVGKHAS